MKKHLRACNIVSLEANHFFYKKPPLEKVITNFLSIGFALLIAKYIVKKNTANFSK